MQTTRLSPGPAGLTSPGSYDQKVYGQADPGYLLSDLTSVFLCSILSLYCRVCVPGFHPVLVLSCLCSILSLYCRVCVPSCPCTVVSMFHPVLVLSCLCSCVPSGPCTVVSMFHPVLVLSCLCSILSLYCRVCVPGFHPVLVLSCLCSILSLYCRVCVPSCPCTVVSVFHLSLFPFFFVCIPGCISGGHHFFVGCLHMRLRGPVS